MNEIVKEIEVVSSCIGDWYSKYIGQKFAVIDPTWWSLAEGDCYYVEHPENDENTVFYVLKNDCKVTKSVAQSAHETTEILNEVKADKGILTEEELRHREMNFQTDYMGSIITDRSFKYVQEIINSHRLLLAANAELSFNNPIAKAKVREHYLGLKSVKGDNQIGADHAMLAIENVLDAFKIKIEDVNA